MIKTIVVTKISSSVILFAIAHRAVFNYFSHFKRNIDSESIDQKQHEKWICLMRVQFTYSTQFEGKDDACEVVKS